MCQPGEQPREKKKRKEKNLKKVLSSKFILAKKYYYVVPGYLLSAGCWRLQARKLGIPVGSSKEINDPLQYLR